MKRITSVIVTIFILFTCCVIPVSASENLNDSFIHVLDYTTPDSSGYLSILHDGDPITFELPYIMRVGYFEGVIESGSVIDSGVVIVGSYEFDLTIIHIDGDFYRFYGNARNYRLNNLTLNFTFQNNSSGFLTFCSLDVMPSSFSTFSDTGSIASITPHGETTDIMSSSASFARTYLQGTQDYDQYDTFVSYIYFDNWKKYDYVDLYIKTYTATINSVACLFGETFIPFEISYLNGDAPGFNSSLEGTSDYPVVGSVAIDRWFVIRLDLTGLDRSSAKYPVVSITGSFNTCFDYNYVALWAVTGYVGSDTISSDLLWYQKIWNSLKSGFQSVVDAIVGDASGGSELVEGAEQIQDGVSDISQFEQDQQAVLDTNFDTIQNAVDIAGFGSAFNFVFIFANAVFEGMGDYVIVFTLPLFLGIFFFICSKIPGATRWRSRPPKDGDG